MPIDAANLMQQIYDYFNNLYTASSPKAFLIFQKLGLPVNPADVPSPADALEYTSTMASYPLVIEQNYVTQDGTRHVYNDMASLLESSMPIDDTSSVPLGAAKQQGATEMGITLGSMTGIPDYQIYPVLATPGDWYDMSQASNWCSYSVGQPPPKPQVPVAKTPPPPVSTAPPSRIPIHPIMWRVATPQLHREFTVVRTGPTLALAGSDMKPAPVRPVRPAAPMRVAVATHSPAANLAPARATASATAVLEHPGNVKTVPGLVADRQLSFNLIQRSLASSRLQTALQNVAVVHANSNNQNVTTSDLDVSFEFCIVGLGWPWLPNGFLMQRNWYLQGYARGEYSNGTGGADPGLLPVLPTGFVAIRNLSITAKWNQQDVSAIQTTVGLSAFSLVGSSFSSQTGVLTCPGIQIVGWFCSALPVLPPIADPHLADN